MHREVWMSRALMLWRWKFKPIAPMRSRALNSDAPARSTLAGFRNKTANALSDGDEFNWTLEEVLKAKDDRIAELEKLLAEKDKVLLNGANWNGANWTWEKTEELKAAMGYLDVEEGQATEGEDSDEDSAELTEKQDTDGLSGGFVCHCKVFHMNMASEMLIPWPIFLFLLWKEGLHFGEHERWSGPLHLQLAGLLKKWAFSTDDWDLSLLRKDNGDLIYSPPEQDAAAIAELDNPVSRSSLSKEKVFLMDRIAIFYRSRFQGMKEHYAKNPNERRKTWSEEMAHSLGVWSRYTPETRSKCTPEFWSKCTHEDLIEYHPDDWKTPMTASL